MLFVTGVVATNFSPKGVGMVHVVEMSEFMNDDVIAERLGDLHEADVERNGAIAATTAPAGSGVTQAALVVLIAIELGVIFEPVR